MRPSWSNAHVTSKSRRILVELLYHGEFTAGGSKVPTDMYSQVLRSTCVDLSRLKAFRFSDYVSD